MKMPARQSCAGSTSVNIGAAVARSSDPFGSYRDFGKPLIVDDNSVEGALDPHYFLDPASNKHFLI